MDNFHIGWVVVTATIIAIICSPPPLAVAITRHSLLSAIGHRLLVTMSQVTTDRWFSRIYKWPAATSRCLWPPSNHESHFWDLYYFLTQFEHKKNDFELYPSKSMFVYVVNARHSCLTCYTTYLFPIIILRLSNQGI